MIIIIMIIMFSLVGVKSNQFLAKLLSSETNLRSTFCMQLYVPYILIVIVNSMLQSQALVAHTLHEEW